MMVRSQDADSIVEDPHLRRAIHAFDFDERDDGNMEDVPMFWAPFRGANFPRFAQGAFDRLVGHESPPAFRLELNGRNVAYRYAGQALKVIPNCAYSVSAWVRYDRLEAARAAISAYFLDREGLPISGTQQFSTLPDPESAADWEQLQVYLPPGPANAAWVGITLWVVQPEIWNPHTRPEHHIEFRDTLGAAWFDDIVVHRLPRAELACERPAHVFTRPEKPRLRVVVTDNDGYGLRATLRVHSIQDPSLEWEHEVDVDTSGTSDGQYIQIPLEDPGLYEARLDILADGQAVASKSLAYAVLGGASLGHSGNPRSFGLVLDHPRAETLAADTAMILASNVGSVKLPIQAPSAKGEQQSKLLDSMLNELIRHRVAVTGMITTPPVNWSQELEKFPPKLMDVLSDDPKGWGPILAKMVSPYATVMRDWQVGLDSDTELANDPRMASALKVLHRQMTGVMTAPRFCAMASANLEPLEKRLPAERMTLFIPAAVSPDWIGDHCAPHQTLGHSELSVYLEARKDAALDRLSGLARWALRIIEARYAGVDTVYVSSLWNHRSTRSGPIMEPTEEFVIYSTLVRILNDGSPAESFDLEAGGKALVFRAGQHTTWVLWNSELGDGVRDYPLQLGLANEQIDLWGRATPLEAAADGRRIVKVSQLPVFVTGVEVWPTVLRATARLEPERVPYSLGDHEHQLMLKNGGREAMSGSIHMVAPEGWEVKPSAFRINIQPGEEASFPVIFQFAGTAGAGVKPVTAQLSLEMPEHLYFDLPLTLTLEIPDLEVWGYVHTQGDRLILRQGITNRSKETLHFRAYATVAGRDRQSRAIPSLPPEGSTMQEYHFLRASELSGRTVRLSLREVDGLRIHNLDLTAP